MIPVSNVEITYLCDGVAKEFPFPYEYYDKSHVVGFVIDADGVTSKIITNFTFNEVSKKFIYPVEGTALTSGNKIKLRRITELSQTLDLPNEYPFGNIEKAQDKLTMIMQELNLFANTNLSEFEDELVAIKNAAIEGSRAVLGGATTALYESTGAGIISGFDATVSMGIVNVQAGIAHMVTGYRKTTVDTQITPNAADTANPRIDIIYLSNNGIVSYLAGTASASPVTPSIPSEGVGLYAIKIATDGTITLTDLRKFKARYQNIEYVSVLDYGAKCDGITDDTVAVQRAINSLKPVKFPAGTCLCNIILPAQFDLQGSMIETTIIKPFNIAKPVITLTGVTSWVQAKISRIVFEGGTSTARTGIGFSFGNMSYTEANDAIAGRVYFSQCGFRYFDKGVIKNFGNIGNIFEKCSFYNNNYGVYSLGAKFHDTSAPNMHSGCDTYIKCEWHDNHVAGFLDLDNDPGVGQFGFYDCIFQGNFGFGMFFDWSTLASDSRSPILISNCWFESNAMLTSVTIDTLSGSTSKTPQDKYFSASAKLNLIQLGRNKLNIGTDSVSGALNVKSITDTCLAAILDADNNYFSSIAFKDSVIGGILGAKSNNAGFLFLEAGTTNGINFVTDSDGSTRIGRDAVANGRSYMTYGESMISPIPGVEGIGILQVVGDVLNYNASRARFYATRGTGENSSSTGMSIGKNSTTSRSINAAGTINASGADYAEYMTKSATCGIIKAGDICGIDKNGQLTDKFSASVSFCVKSTDPSYVGGDVWGSELTEPILYAKTETETDEDYAARKAEYESQLIAFKAALETARAKVDRIAFCGQVPVNVTGATVGQYIVPSANGTSITGECVASPTFDQYMMAVGRVVAIEDDGRARIIVKVA